MPAMVRNAGIELSGTRPVDVGDDPHHQVADHDQRGRDRRVDERCPRRPARPAPTSAMIGTKKIASANSAGGDERGEAGARALGDAGAALDVGRHARDAHRAADRGRARVDQQQPVGLRQPALVVEHPAAAADRDRGADRVEEVGHEQREDHRDQRHRQRVAEVAGIERSPMIEKSSELGSVDDLVRGVEHAEDQAERRWRRTRRGSPRRARRARPARPPRGCRRARSAPGPT